MPGFPPACNRFAEENAVPATHLTQARINALRPRRTVRTLRDSAIRGFGIRVLPSGAKRFFIHTQSHGRRIWKLIADADAVSLDEARRRAKDLLGAIRCRGETAPAASEQTRFEAVAEEVFRNYGRHWKPRTRKVNRGYLRNQILPWFEGRPIADITRADVQRWLASLHATPAAADRSAPILSVILREAEAYGYRPEGTNPCVGIRRYRRRGRERFLSEQELRRLSVTLERHAERRPLHAAFLRLLLLTGCRKGEIATLEWSAYREGHLFLTDSKTGPRTVWLSSPARAALGRLPRTAKWVFPSATADRALCAHSFETFWRTLRAEANLPDVRLHDCRHTVATHAVMQGVALPVVARLLGHRHPRMTLRYAHVGDSEIEAAAERVGQTVARLMAVEEAAGTSGWGDSDTRRSAGDGSSASPSDAARSPAGTSRARSARCWRRRRA